MKAKYENLPTALKDKRGRWVGTGYYQDTSDDNDIVWLTVHSESEKEEDSIYKKGTIHADSLVVDKRGKQYAYEIQDRYYNEVGRLKLLRLRYIGKEK